MTKKQSPELIKMFKTLAVLVAHMSRVEKKYGMMGVMIAVREWLNHRPDGKSRNGANRGWWA